jgi:hypothetical protein
MLMPFAANWNMALMYYSKRIANWTGPLPPYKVCYLRFRVFVYKLQLCREA